MNQPDNGNAQDPPTPPVPQPPDPASSTDVVMESPSSPPPDPAPSTDIVMESTTASFKAILLADVSVKEDNQDPRRNFYIEDNDVSFGNTDGIPAVTFSSKARQCMNDAMQFSVVVKVVGRTVGYTVLRNRLIALWKPVKDFKIIDLDNNYYLVRLNSKEEYLRAVLEGPWSVFGHYLSVQPWSPCFEPMEEKLSSLAVWIRLPGLPVQYYNHSILRAICKPIGNFLKIDNQTSEAQRGRFARIAVELNLEAPLVSRIMVDGKIRVVQYEDLYAVCLVCGKYGHNKGACPDARKEGGNSMEMETGNSSSVAPEPVLGNQPSPTPWLVVSRRGRKKPVKETKASSKDTEDPFKDGGHGNKKQSRFEILSNLEDSSLNEDLVVSSAANSKVRPAVLAEKSAIKHGHSSGKGIGKSDKGKQIVSSTKNNEVVIKEKSNTSITDNGASEPMLMASRQVENKSKAINLCPLVPVPVTLDPSRHTALALGPSLTVLQPKHTRVDGFLSLNQRLGNGERPNRKKNATVLKTKKLMKSPAKKQIKADGLRIQLNDKENSSLAMNCEVNLAGNDATSASTSRIN